MDRGMLISPLRLVVKIFFFLEQQIKRKGGTGREVAWKRHH